MAKIGHGRRTGRRATDVRTACWSTHRARRIGLLVDAAAYFAAFRAAASRARHSILIVGWSINSRARLDFPDAEGNAPELGPFLTELAERPDGPAVRILVWDSPLILGREREWSPRAGFGAGPESRLEIALDDQHPLGASLHQKLVVIDDAVAFVGGIDLTIDRLDDPSHRPDDPRRCNADGSSYAPFHDVQAAVDGPAARALAAVARERWERATGTVLAPVEAESDPWPDELPVDIADAEVAIARTYPPWRGARAIREVERLHLASIAQARETIYIENQYFTATSVAAALCRRLRRPDSPEIVLVLPREPMNWVEGAALAARQSRLLARLRRNDRYGRLRIYAPMVGDDGSEPLKLHAKVTVIDDSLLRIGSANLNNRSMGLDAECDIAVLAEPGTPVAAAIARFRDRLLAEHLAASPDAVAEARQRRGSLIAGIESLRRPGRSLVELPRRRPGLIETALADWAALDPRTPAAPEIIADDLARDRSERAALRAALLRLAVLLALLLGAAAAWHAGLLATLVEVESVAALSAALQSWTGIALMLGAFVAGSLVMFPVVALILAAGLFYGPLGGLAVAAAGSLLGAIAGYGMGALLGRRPLRRALRGRLDHVVRKLASHGAVAVAVIRILPVAPFTLINLAAGAARLPLRDFLLGTLAGMAPGLVVLTLFAGQLGHVLRAPSWTAVAGLVGWLLVIAGAALWAWRRIVAGRPVPRPRQPTAGPAVPGSQSAS